MKGDLSRGPANTEPVRPALPLLWDHIGAPFSDQGTSLAAAQRIAPYIPALEARVLEALRAAGEHGATDKELEAATGLAHETCSARRRWCVLRGLVVDSGLRRPTPSGRAAVVWRAR